MRFSAMLIIFGMCLLHLSSQAATYVINPDGTGKPFATIQEAASHHSVVSGDTLLLEDGIYRGPENHNIDFEGKDLVLLSESDNPELCIIDCEGSSPLTDTERGFFFHSGETNAALVRGIKIYDGLASAPS